jgi:hypothetical protein
MEREGRREREGWEGGRNVMSGRFLCTYVSK